MAYRRSPGKGVGGGGGRAVIPYMGYIGMCRRIGYLNSNDFVNHARTTSTNRSLKFLDLCVDQDQQENRQHYPSSGA